MPRITFIILTLLLLTGCSNKTVRQLLDNGFQEDGAKAVRLYTRAISKDKNNVEAYWRRGNEYYKMKEYDKSIADLNKAISIEAAFNNGYLFGDRGNTKEAMNDLKGAIEDYTKALFFCKTNEPSTPRENFYFYRGRTHIKLGDTASAIKDTDSALYLWNTFPRAKLQKARLLVMKEKYEDAIPYYTGFLDPSSADDKEYLEDVFYLGLLKFKTGDTTYCDYWKAAAKNRYPKAIEYVSKYCKKE
jgi:tetratricopeptide (TPR) repeat protein